MLILLDREQGSAEGARNAGMQLHSLIPFKSDGVRYLKGQMKDDEWELVADYAQHPDKYQDPRVIEEVLQTRKKVG